MNKLTHYKIPVSPRFLSNHPRRGQNTYFNEKIQLALSGCKGSVMMYASDMTVVTDFKIHTIRKNYPLWKKRMQKVHAGKAVIDLCYWKLPGGRFTQGNELITFATLDKDSGCGVQELIFSQEYDSKGLIAPMVNDIMLCISELSENDGLGWLDFRDWFKKYDITKSMAIIHFTPFRY